MTTNYLKCILLLAILSLELTLKAQLVGPNAYIKATSIEIGIDGAGGFEGCSTTASPPLPLMHFRSANPLFGFVANPQLNAWLTFDGDFFTPGTPENGWGIDVTGGPSASNNCAAGGFGTGPDVDIAGTITDWSNIFSCYSVDWEGDLTAGTNLHFKVNYFLQETDLFYTTTVYITNNTSATIPELFYYRNLDPDNNVELSSDYSTQNTIVSQPGTGCNLAHVSATSLVPASQPQSYLGLAAVGPNYRVCYGGFSNRDGSDLWNGTGFTQTVGSSISADEAISLAYRIQNLAPGATEIIKFVVILDDASASQAINNLLYLSYPGSVSATPSACTPYTDTIPTCGGPVPISISGTNVSDYTWSWSPTTGLSSSTGPSVIANPPGTTTYTVSGTPISGCVAPVSFTFIVQLTPGGGANPVISAVPPLCANDPPITLTVDSTGGTWVGTGITNSSTGTFDPAVSGAGTFTIAYNISVACGDTAVQTITVNAVPTPGFSSSVSTGCDPICVTFSESASSNCNSVVYSFGDGDSSLVSGPTHCYDSAGVYSVSLQCTGANGCVGNITIPNMITVSPSPIADFTISPSSTVDPNTTVTFTDITPGSVNSLWVFDADSSLSSSSSTTSYFYENEGEYCILLVSENSSGCIDSAKYCIIVLGEATIFIPNVFTPNGDGNNDLFLVSSTKMKEIYYDIYDRWGLKIATYNELTGGWNGRTKNGKMAPDGTYYYVLKATSEKGKEFQQEGFIQLLSEK
jgi:gliding motility-associated-like protein